MQAIFAASTKGGHNGALDIRRWAGKVRFGATSEVINLLS